MSLLFSYYGDDFTGSTDALETLAIGGVRTVLFLGVPTDRHYQKFAGYQAVGVAGESRSRTPAWMKQALPGIFEWIGNLNPAIVQYKVCSTFDSSSRTGNIATAMQIGRQTFGTDCVFVVVAAPHLRRYVLFGNLFAASGQGVYRIDRHPTMSEHPVTPMHESDLRLHLREQGEPSPELLDVRALGKPEALEDLLSRRPSSIIFDGLDERTERATGALLWNNRAQHRFVVGSSGLTRSLIARIGDKDQVPLAAASVADRIIVISGSCSPVTFAQIQWATSNGFAALHSSSEQVLTRGLESLARGQSLIVYSALGPQNREGSLSGESLGRHLGTLLRELILKSGVRRAIIAGGDTSSHAMTQLGIHALTFAAPLAPGAPLCHAHADKPSLDGLELVLKGGQIGNSNFFEQVRKGQQS